MTGFDNIMRSQAMVGEDRRFYDSQRYEAQRGQADAIAGFGQTLQRERQLAMQQQGMEQDMQRFQQEYALQRADVDMRLQQHQQQVQLMDMKLQAMAKIDQADGMRAQVRTATAQAQLAELQAKMAQKKFDEYDQSQSQDVEESTLRGLGGARGAYAAGLIYDPTKPIGGRLRLPLSKDELREFGARVDQSYEREGSGNVLIDRNRVGQEIQRLNSELETAEPDRAAEIQQILPQLHREYRGYFPNGSAPAPKATPKPSAVDTKAVDEIAGRIVYQRPTNPMESMGAGQQDAMSIGREVDSPAAKKMIAERLWMLRSRLREKQQAGYDRDPARRGLSATEQTAIDEALAIINSPSDPRRQLLLQALLSQ